jgi:membrane protein YqaA with SNARE-associated domain
MVHARMLKRIYDWCIDAADKPYALWILAAVSFAESSFFPIPPDIMLLPMSLARPKRAWWFAAVCTIASVAGGVVGYAIGALLYDSLGQWLINLYGLSGKVEAFRQSYAEWGAVIILLKGLTPIPYKLVTITSGFAGYNLWLFILCSIVARILHRIPVDLTCAFGALPVRRFGLRSQHVRSKRPVVQAVGDARRLRMPRPDDADGRPRQRLAAGRATTFARRAATGSDRTGTAAGKSGPDQ